MESDATVPHDKPEHSHHTGDEHTHSQDLTSHNHDAHQGHGEIL